MEELTFTDGTAEGGRRGGRRRLTLVPVDILDEPERDSDGDREVDFESEEAPVLPDPIRDDTERGRGMAAGGQRQQRQPAATIASSRTARRTGPSGRAAAFPSGVDRARGGNGPPARREAR